LGVTNFQGRTLADDIPFASMSQQAEGSPTNIMIALSRIMSTYRPSIESMVKDWGSDFNPDDIVRIFGASDTGLVGTMKANANGVDGQLFLPLDYDRAIRVISQGAKDDGDQDIDPKTRRPRKRT
jgi:hypothetical protein